MVAGSQIAGLFLLISAVLAFTVWAESWLASTAAPAAKLRPNPKGSIASGLADLGNGDDVARAA